MPNQAFHDIGQTEEHEKGREKEDESPGVHVAQYVPQGRDFAMALTSDGGPLSRALGQNGYQDDDGHDDD